MESKQQQAYRDRIRPVICQAVEEAANCEEGQELAKLPWAIETMAVLIQFAAMIGLMNAVKGADFVMAAESLFDLVAKNRPDRADERSRSRMH